MEEQRAGRTLSTRARAEDADHVHFGKWQTDAVKAVTKEQLKPGEWHHVFVCYDGGGRASGLKVYVNGAAKETAVEADSLKGSIKTKVPFKLAQRNNSLLTLGAFWLVCTMERVWLTYTITDQKCVACRLGGRCIM